MASWCNILKRLSANLMYHWKLHSPNRFGQRRSFKMWLTDSNLSTHVCFTAWMSNLTPVALYVKRNWGPSVNYISWLTNISKFVQLQYWKTLNVVKVEDIHKSKLHGSANRSSPSNYILKITLKLNKKGNEWTRGCSDLLIGEIGTGPTLMQKQCLQFSQ